MPLDYGIWGEIDKKMVKTAPRGIEKRDAFLKRLEHCARTLPRGYIRKTIPKMKTNIQAIVDARGCLPRSD